MLIIKVKDQITKHCEEQIKKYDFGKRSDNSEFHTFADLYEIKNSQLNDFNSLNQLKAQLRNFK